MLKSLTLKSFQTHKHLQIQFDQSIVCLTGESDSGKTACLRALRWLATNKPSGDAFLRHGDKDVEVTLEIDHHTITRAKGKEGNLYSLDGKEFRAFGTSVPEEILSALNIDEGINFQGQLEAPFWFLKTPGEVSRELNKIVNLERIDAVLSLSASEVKKTKLTVEVSQERLDQARKEEDRLEWVEQAHQEYQSILTLEEDIAFRRTRIASIASALEEARHIASRRQILSEAILETQELIGRLDKIEKLQKTVNRVEDLLEEVRRCQEKRRELKREVSRLKEVIQSEKVCPLCGK
jgi:exonuclease SbcC